jgi:hypothetical protein
METFTSPEYLNNFSNVIIIASMILVTYTTYSFGLNELF